MAVREWLLAAVLSLAMMADGAAQAQSLADWTGTGAEPTAAVDPLDQGAIAERRTQVRSQLDALDTAAGAQPAGAAERLRRIDSLLAHQAELAAHLAAPVDGAAKTTAQPATEPDPTVFSLYALYEQRYEAEQSDRRIQAELVAGRKAMEAAKEALESAEKSRRQARSELQAAAANEKAALQRTLALRELDSRVAAEELHLRTLELRGIERRADERPDTGALDARIAGLKQKLARGEAPSEEGYAVLVRREAELRRQHEAAERRLETAELRLEAARNRFAKEATPSAGSLAEVEALTVRRDAIRQEIALADADLERLGEQRTVWRRWDAVLRGQASGEDLSSWQDEAGDRGEALKSDMIQRQGRIADLQGRLDVIEGRLAETTEDARVLAALTDQKEILGRAQAAQLAEVAALAADQRLTGDLLEEIHDRTGHVDPLEYVADGARAAREVWSYEITAVDDAPITVGSLFLALILLGIGTWASRRGSALAGSFAEGRLRLDAGAAHALQTITFYVLLVAFALLALRAIHFPLTAFTVLGGALAIGVGFGSQNVMNNFISGLILMLERPVRARDVVEVDGNHGTIENIGARSTQIRSTDGRHIIVPNSFFLENNVVNWTLSDELIRAKVTVGVIYGSPTRLVEELIMQVVREDDQVIAHPAPIIIFEEFGDNSLNFDVYFWVRARTPMDVRRVQSRIRFRIDDLFRAHDLVIAFPQRDVHLDTASPLEVRVLEPSDREAATRPDEDVPEGGD